LNSTPPIRSRASEEGSFQIPLWGIPFVLTLLYICFFSGLGALGLVGPDEPRYAAIARAMAETNDWITPRLWGTPWFEKPVLYYWTGGLAMRLFGVSEFAARLPSALAALLAAAAIKWTALRSYGLGTAWYSLLLLPTSVAMIGFSRAAGPDMLFASLLTAAMAVACEMLQKPRPGPILRVAFGFFLGAAVLAKGPAAIILAGGATLLWAAITGNRRAPFRFLHPMIIAVFCATALPWYVLCALRNPEFLRVFIWQHNFERYLTPIFEHRQPFWFYVPVLAIASMPWIGILGTFFCTRWKKKEAWRESPMIFILCWAFLPFVFFSFSQSKLPGYILPTIPPMFLLMSRAAERLSVSSRRIAATAIGMTGAFFVALALDPINTISNLGHLFAVPDARMVTLRILAGVGGLITIGFSWAKPPTRAITAAALLTAALLAFMNIKILPAADRHLSARTAARDCLRFNPSGENVAFFGLSRESRYGLDYYFGREIPEWMPGTPSPEWLLTTSGIARGLIGDRFNQVSSSGEPFVVLLKNTPPEDLSK
jgi:4-amino-4-deoxy-L-arabinose transferase-like glycosyltransferase